MRRSIRNIVSTFGLVAALGLTACSTTDDNSDTTATGAAGSATGATAADADQLLSAHGMSGMDDVVEIIDHLDRLGGSERPQDLIASVRPDQLVLSSGGDEVTIATPSDAFYLSVAPYVHQTHECYNHSLTTCTGELASTEVEVQIVDETNDEVLVEKTVTTFENGFVGFWLPRDIKGTIKITYDGRSGEADIATGTDDPTCLTTVRLA
ncbi:CueP family metal-binding protein [Aeromicrobium piscarium]|uniref:CueP family metal-binding protein n=1 Tax=Aeromicrobium piscarium TaxID=2590901 RepID=UPI001C8F980F|nr:CueP family metal-binding protein [Aeromicrobium piscarium]